MPNEVKLLPTVDAILRAYESGEMDAAGTIEDLLAIIDSRPTTVVTDEVVELPRKALVEAREYLEAFRLKEDGAARMREIDRMPVRQLCKLIDEALTRSAIASMPTVVTGEQPEDLGAIPGSHPADQAPSGLGASRFDPERGE